MAEFVQTMKDWRRMCQYMDKEYGNSSCDNCPLGGCSAVYEMCGKENFTNMERDISAWAADHPEPVYPTWFEWLEERKILAAAKSEGTETIFDTVLPTPAMFDSIPADVAEALKIPPKEEREQ